MIYFDLKSENLAEIFQILCEMLSSWIWKWFVTKYQKQCWGSRCAQIGNCLPFRIRIWNHQTSLIWIHNDLMRRSQIQIWNYHLIRPHGKKELKRQHFRLSRFFLPVMKFILYITTLKKKLSKFSNFIVQISTNNAGSVQDLQLDTNRICIWIRIQNDLKSLIWICIILAGTIRIRN